MILLIVLCFKYFFLFVVGLGLGSFLNVVSLRFRPDSTARVFNLKKLGGRSQCPFCQKKLHWYELIPLLSFFIQKGKCRSCREKISWQYPIVELLSGLILVAAPNAVWAAALLVLLLIAIIDFRYFLIPDELVWLLVFLGFLDVFLETSSFLGYYAWLFGGPTNLWLNHLLGALVGGIFFGLLFYAGQGKIMGGGDVKLGLALGWLLGWSDLILSLIITFLLGGFCGFILWLSRRRTMKDYLPLAPFLAIGAGLTVLFGYQIMRLYFSLMGL